MKETGDIVVSQSQLAVYTTLKKIGPTSDQDLIYTMREELGSPMSESGIRTRRDELVKMGLVREKSTKIQGQRVKLKTWYVTQKKVHDVRE